MAAKKKTSARATKKKAVPVAKKKSVKVPTAPAPAAQVPAATDRGYPATLRDEIDRVFERFFRDLSEKALKRGSFYDVNDLVGAITEYVNVHNEDPKPFIWTAKANDILAKVDRASMLHGLEVRSPFLDTGVVDVAMRLPTRLKFHRGRGKRILRDAMRGLLPDTVLERAKKGFGMPIGGWLRDGALPLAGAPSCGLSADFHARRLREHRAGRADHRLYLFAQWLLDAVARRIDG